MPVFLFIVKIRNISTNYLLFPVIYVPKIKYNVIMINKCFAIFNRFIKYLWKNLNKFIIAIKNL